MSDIGKAYVQIVPSAKGLEGAISGQLDGEASKAGQSAGTSIVSTLKKVFIAAGIGKALLSTLTEGGKLQQSLGGIETLFKDNADRVKGYTKEAYRTTGLSANAYMENVTGFSASLLQSLGGNTKKAAETANMAMIDMADNSNKMGTSMEAIQNAYQGFAKQNYTMLDNLKLGYGGTKKEMERLLKDAQKITGVKYDINNLNDVYEAIHVIQGELDITGTTAKEASTTFTGSFNAMKASFQDVLGALALGEGLEPALQGLAGTVSTFLFGNLIPMIGNILAQLPGMLITFVQIALPQFVQMGTDMINSLASGFDFGMDGFWANFSEMINVFLTDYLPQFLETGVSLITELTNGLISALPNVITGMGEILDTMLVICFDALPKILQAGYDIIKNLAMGIWNNLPAITKSIVDVLDKLLRTILDNLPHFLEKGIELIGRMAMGIWNNLPQIISTLTNLLIALIRKIGEYLPQFLQKGVELIGKMLAGIVQKAPELIVKLPAIIVQILASIGRFTAEFVSMGGQLLMGLARGIAGAVKNVISSAIDACKSVVNKVKSFFGIHSPSRVFAEIGEFLNLGLAEGIEDNIKPVQNAMEEVAKETQRSFTSELNHNIISTNPQSMFEKTNGENALITNSDRDNKTSIELILHLGNNVFKTFVEDITNLQDEKLELELAY
ncbi:phage tail protein [Parvimonas sp. G1967]|uniref:phage tail protein n=1 Tax=Parvimonas sp. G1967 TaxID=3387695 RepID=UPI0039E3B62D